MKKFVAKMFSTGDEVSSKRVAAFFVLINLIALTYISTLMSKEKVTPQFMFEALALIAGGGLGLTVIEKIFVKKIPEISNNLKTVEEQKNDSPQDLTNTN